MRLSSAHGFAACIGLLIVGVGVSGLRLRAASASGQAARDKLTECRSITDRIIKLRSQPSRATLAAPSATEITTLIQSAVEANGLPTSSLISIEPHPPHPIEQTSYKIQSTRMAMKPMTLQQLTDVIASITDGEMGLQASQIELVPASRTNAPDDNERWSPTVMFVRLVFDPASLQTAKSP